MKAGKAGSIPDSAPEKKDTISFALTQFMRDVGEAVANLNTVAVGLDAVEKGHQKPETLNISWNPDDRTAAARKARKFVLESVLIHVSEAMNQYIAALSKLPRFAKIREGWNAKGADDSAAGKLTAIATEILGEGELLVSASALLIHWRNRIVHEKSRAKLNHKLKMLLHESEEEILRKYDNLNIDCLLCHFDNGRPTLKDVTTLISMTIGLAWRMDAKVHEYFDADDLQAWLDHYEISPLLKKVASETKPEKRLSAIRNVFRTHAPQLLKSYERIQLADQTNDRDSEG
jgi:hypothetical protein